MGCAKSKPSYSANSRGDIGASEHKLSDSSSRTYVLHELMDEMQKSPSSEIGWNNCVQVVPADIATIETIYDGVTDGKILGYGRSGVIRLITHKETGAQFAVKSLSLKQIGTFGEAGLDQLREEFAILMQIDHPNIVQLEAVYESEDFVYLVQELCSGGDLFDRLDAQPEDHYSEAQCARIVKQMLSAVRYIHSHGIIHRDLKLENWLFSAEEDGDSSTLKMIDFGLSKHIKCGETNHDPVGSR